MSAEKRSASDTQPGDRSLPLPQIASSRYGRPMWFGMSKLDAHGRLATRFFRDVLGWIPGQRVDLSLTTDHILIAATASAAPRPSDTAAVINGLGWLIIPAGIRRRAGIGSGDHLLLAADHDPNTLHLYPPAVLTLALRQYRPDEAPR